MDLEKQNKKKAVKPKTQEIKEPDSSSSSEYESDSESDKVDYNPIQRYKEEKPMVIKRE